MYSSDHRAKVTYRPARFIKESDLRLHALDRLNKAWTAFRFHLSEERRDAARSKSKLYDDIFSALAEVSESTDANTTRLADEIHQLAEAIHGLRNAFVRQQSSYGEKRFAVFTELVDCLFYADPEDDEVHELLTAVAVEALNINTVPELFTLAYALRDVKNFTHGSISPTT